MTKGNPRTAFSAARKGNLTAVMHFIDNDLINPTAKEGTDEDTDTLLTCACANGRTRVVFWLLRHHFPAPLVRSRDLTAALDSHRFVIIQKIWPLLNEKQLMLGIDRYLHGFDYQKEFMFFKLFDKYSHFMIHGRMEDGKSLFWDLSRFVDENQWETMYQLLKNRKAEQVLNCPDQNGTSPAMIAREFRYTKWLISKNLARITDTDKSHKSWLLWFCERRYSGSCSPDDFREGIELFQKEGGDLEATNPEGLSAVYLMVINLNITYLQILIQMGANITKKTDLSRVTQGVLQEGTVLDFARYWENHERIGNDISSVLEPEDHRSRRDDEEHHRGSDIFPDVFRDETSNQETFPKTPASLDSNHQNEHN